MQYKLIENSLNDTNNIVETILLNRGIKNPEHYLNLDESVLCNYHDLENIDEAVKCFDYHFCNRHEIGILVDQDPDGYCSGSIMYRYIKAMDEAYPVHYFIHERNKAHGLASFDLNVFRGLDLLIIPDAGTNDTDYIKELMVEYEISVIVLDHHMQEEVGKDNPAIVVNNQISSNYSNKDCCGTHITWEFLRALDDYYWNCYSDYYIDLVALANISDIMNMLSEPTRYITDEGLKHIHNKLFETLLNAQSYSTKGIVSIHNISWYITPILNSLIRIGSYEDRTLLFRAFIDDYEEFDYKKRGGEVVKENIYERVTRLCKNSKSRQDKMRDKIFEQLIDKVNLDDKVCMVEVDDIDVSGIIGLSAMKLADSIQRPCIIVNKMLDSNGNEVLNGSCRNFNNSPVESLKEVIDETSEFIFCQGHNNAAGVSLYADNFEAAKQALNESLKDITYDPSYMCDFIIDIDSLSISFIQDVDKLSWLWCTGIKEPLICIKNIQVTKKDIHIQGKDRDSIAFTINDIKFVQFKLKNGDPIYDFINDWLSDENELVTLNVIGECSINDYKGILTPQVLIKDSEVIYGVD